MHSKWMMRAKRASLSCVESKCRENIYNYNKNSYKYAQFWLNLIKANIWFPFHSRFRFMLIICYLLVRGVVACMSSELARHQTLLVTFIVQIFNYLKWLFSADFLCYDSVRMYEQRLCALLWSSNTVRTFCHSWFSELFSHHLNGFIISFFRHLSFSA